MRKVSIGLGTIAAVCALVAPASALAAQTLTIKPTTSGKLGGAGKIGLGFTITSTTGGIPSPLSGPFIEQIPKGITYAKSGFPTCPLAVVQAASGSAPPACPAATHLGVGTSVTQAQVGATMINENAVVDAYLVSLHPYTLGFWGNGTTPILTTVNWTGVLNVGGSGQFGSNLNSVTPVIPTVPGGPNASVTQFHIIIGGTVKKGKKTISAITLPKKCSGVLHWGASASFADGSTAPATGTSPCPKK